MLRSMSIAAVRTFITEPSTINRLLTSVTTLTTHSLKATFLSELAHAHADPQVLMSQGHWKTTEMPAKYTGNRKAISVKGIKEIIASLKAEWDGEDVNSGIGFSEHEEDEAVAESSVIDRASAPSGSEQRKPHEGDVRQCGAVKAGLSDAAPAKQASQNKTVRSKTRSKDESTPDRSFFATLAALDSKRSSCEATLHFGTASLDRLMCNRIPLSSCEFLGWWRPPFGRLCLRCEQIAKQE